MQLNSQHTEAEYDREVMFTQENGISFHLTASHSAGCAWHHFSFYWLLSSPTINASRLSSSTTHLLPVCCLKVTVIVTMITNQATYLPDSI